ncbi:MAG TPA: DUF4097 family beta strand repeat-containing protein [Bacillales bacterium]
MSDKFSLQTENGSIFGGFRRNLFFDKLDSNNVNVNEIQNNKTVLLKDPRKEGRSMGKEPFLHKMKRYIDDFDETFGGERKTESDHIDSEGMEELEISAEETDVVVHTHEKEIVDLKLETYEGGPTLETDKTGVKVRVNVHGRKSGITFGRRSLSELRIFVPKRLWAKVSIETQSGEIAVADVEASRFGSKSGSGEVEIRGVRASEASVKTGSGKLEVKEFEGESFSFASESGEVLLAKMRGNIQGKNRSGEISVYQCEGMEIHLKNKSGSIEARKVTAENVSLRTSSGEIEMDELRARETLLDSRSGEIIGGRLTGDLRSKATSGEVELDFTEAGRNIFVETNSGDIELRQKGKTWNAELKIETNSGDIEVPAETVGIRRDHYYEGAIGSGEGRIELRSRSGDIAIF